MRVSDTPTWTLQHRISSVHMQLTLWRKRRRRSACRPVHRYRILHISYNVRLSCHLYTGYAGMISSVELHNHFWALHCDQHDEGLFDIRSRSFDMMPVIRKLLRCISFICHKQRPVGDVPACSLQHYVLLVRPDLGTLLSPAIECPFLMHPTCCFFLRIQCLVWYMTIDHLCTLCCLWIVCPTYCFSRSALYLKS